MILNSQARDTLKNKEISETKGWRSDNGICLGDFERFINISNSKAKYENVHYNPISNNKFMLKRRRKKSRKNWGFVCLLPFLAALSVVEENCLVYKLIFELFILQGVNPQSGLSLVKKLFAFFHWITERNKNFRRQCNNFSLVYNWKQHSIL